MEFFCNNECNIDLKERTVRIGDRYLEINEEKREEIEPKIVERFKQTDENILLEKMIKEFKLKNPSNGCIRNSEHVIELTSNKPVQCRPYSVPFKYMQQLKNKIQEMEKDGIIRKTNSVFSTPTFVLLKKSGDIRLIHDYVKLNAQIKKDVW